MSYHTRSHNDTKDTYFQIFRPREGETEPRLRKLIKKNYIIQNPALKKKHSVIHNTAFKDCKERQKKSP